VSEERQVPFSLDLPPWETTPTASLSGGKVGDVAPLLLDGEQKVTPQVEAAPKFPMDCNVEDLEIYRRAENFKCLKLLSGATVGEPVLQYVKKHYGKEGVLRYNFAKYLMDSLNFVPSDDVLLLLSCTKKARLVIATAGAGKTTSLQLDLIVSEMYDQVTHEYHLEPLQVEGTNVTLPPILYLNYNRHNVQPILDRFNGLARRVKKKLSDFEPVEIESSTVHAFCHKWLQAFASEVDIPELKIMDDTTREKVWLAVATPRWKRFYQEEVLGIDWNILDTLYQYKTESMMDWEDFFLTAKFVDTDLKPDFVKSCIKKYDSMKKQLKLMDFTDYLLWMIEVLRDHEDLRTRIQDRYKIIVADENQDFTLLMNELLLLMHNPAKNRLLVVGDPDQTIYQFRGVSPDNVVNIYKRLEDVELLGLDTNYRCPDKIVDAAKRILAMNVLRFEKPIKTVRTGGKVLSHPLRDRLEQVDQVFATLKAIGEDNWNRTVIAYRNNRSSIELGEELYYRNIPFCILDDKRPFNNMCFKQIRMALQALYEKDNSDYNKCLFRFMPVSRDYWEQIINLNAKQRITHIEDLMLPRNTPNGTAQALKVLTDISMRIDKSPCSDFMGVLFELYTKYNYNFLMQNPNPAVGDESIYELYLERTKKFWLRPYTFEYMLQELKERNIDRSDAMTLSTFHGLKGLEFDYVLAIDFMESIFPNQAKLTQKYSPNTAMEELESENRLCYVLTTRAIKELHLFYLASDPSLYVECLIPSSEVFDADDSHNLVMGSPMFAGDTTDSRLRFIQKMTGERR